MFWRKKVTEEMYTPAYCIKRIEELEARVRKLETELAPLQVGEPSLWWPGWKDTGPTISLHDAILRILNALKLEFVETKAVPAWIELVKRKSK